MQYPAYGFGVEIIKFFLTPENHKLNQMKSYELLVLRIIHEKWWTWKTNVPFPELSFHAILWIMPPIKFSLASQLHIQAIIKIQLSRHYHINIISLSHSKSLNNHVMWNYGIVYSPNIRSRLKITVFSNLKLCITKQCPLIPNLLR